MLHLQHFLLNLSLSECAFHNCFIFLHFDLWFVRKSTKSVPIFNANEWFGWFLLHFKTYQFEI